MVNRSLPVSQVFSDCMWDLSEVLLGERNRIMQLPCKFEAKEKRLKNK